MFFHFFVQGKLDGLKRKCMWSELKRLLKKKRKNKKSKDCSSYRLMDVKIIKLEIWDSPVFNGHIFFWNRVAMLVDSLIFLCQWRWAQVHLFGDLDLGIWFSRKLTVENHSKYIDGQVGGKFTSVWLLSGE